MKKALTIAGSDSGGGAGIQQDLKVFSSLRVFGTSVVCAVTAQNTLGVQDFEALTPSIVSAQIDSVMGDIKPDAVKTGMLVNSGIIDVVYRKAKQYKIKKLVVDPVMVSTSGHRLLDEEAVESMRKLFSVALLSTPNIPEAEALTGIRIRNHADMQEAAREIGDCLVKGGHLKGTDYLFYGGEMTTFPAKTYYSGKIHGTGCALSAAITAYLALGYDVSSSVGRAKEFLDESITRVFSVGSGLVVLDTGLIKAGRTYQEPGKKKVIEDIEEAVKIFVEDPNSYRLIPQVGTNIAYALPGAKRISEVAGLSGRIVRNKMKPAAVGVIDFGATHHMGRVVLTAMRYDKSRRACINISFNEEMLAACKKLRLRIGEFDRDRQPKDKVDLEFGTAECIKRTGKVPDVVFDRGGIGKEAIMRVFGRDAKEAVEIALRIVNKLDR